MNTHFKKLIRSSSIALAVVSGAAFGATPPVKVLGFTEWQFR